MTPEQAAFLSTLAYSKGLHEGSLITEDGGKTIGDYLFPGGQPCKKNLGGPQDGFSSENWDSFLGAASNQPDITNLKVIDIETNEYDGGAMITMVDPETRQAVIVYQGTAGGDGWKEDFKSGYGYTKSQKRAVEYAEKMTAEIKKDNDGWYVYATGHSKGGNQAALAAVHCDGVDAAIAFDAPGNGAEYYNDPKRAKLAEQNAYKVTYYSNENCFVSPMNPRFNSKQYWLKSGFDEWSGMEVVKGLLAFSPMAHSTQHLFNKDYSFSYAAGPSEHQVEICRFVEWLEHNFTKGDCAYLLDAVGALVAKLTSMGKPEEYHLTLEEIYKVLGPKATALLLAALEEYPYSNDLLKSILDEKLYNKLVAAKTVRWVALKTNVPGISQFFLIADGFLTLVKTKLGNGPLRLIKMHKDAAKARMAAKNAINSAGKAIVRTYMAVFHRHDFTEEKLALIESIARSFTNSPLDDLFNHWSMQFIGFAFFGWLHLSFFSGVVNGAKNLLDGAIDSGVRTIRQRFQQAWETDARCGGKVGSSRQHVAAAKQKISGMM